MKFLIAALALIGLFRASPPPARRDRFAPRPPLPYGQRRASTYDVEAREW